MPIKKEINLDEFTEIIDGFSDLKTPLIPILHVAQNLYGYVPIDIQNLITKKLKIPNTEINGVVSFYHMFHENPTGKHHIGVCTGTSCHLNGSNKILKHLEDQLLIKEAETSDDGQFTIVPVKCMGDCDKGPTVILDENIYNDVTKEELDKIINMYKKNDN